nr:J539 [uncultured bacterium]
MVCSGVAAPDLPARLDRAIVSHALDGLGRNHLLLHAGMVAWCGRGLMLPAPSGSGKTTLVAGLLRAGLDYVTDEVVVVDRASSRALPFARSLCLKAGGRRALQDRYPEIENSKVYPSFGPEPVSFMTPRRSDWIAAPVPVTTIVFPRFVPGAPTTLVGISRTEAFERLLGQVFNLTSHTGDRLAQLIDLISGAECYRLITGNLDESVELIERTMQE